MNIIHLAILIGGTVIGAIFNYLLNRAPGSEPEDYRIGPAELNITCDCAFNPLIISGIATLVVAISSGVFDSRMELYLAGLFVFSIITIAGIIGRRRRHEEWRELEEVFSRALVTSHIHSPIDSPPDIFYDEDDDSDYY